MKQPENVRLFDHIFLTDDPDNNNVEAAVEKGMYRNFGKRVMDIVLVLVGLPFVLPVMFVIALAIFKSGGPVFYSQARLGLNGRVFRLWKFRSMVVDADEALADYLASNPDSAKEWQISQKLRRDPRITTVGHFIRKTSLDELPQLLNVLKGDMSLVGPRPMMPEQREMYPGTRYEKLHPGISGFWQISERNNVSFAERARFDSEYYNKLSLATDIVVLTKTLAVVCRGSGV